METSCLKSSPRSAFQAVSQRAIWPPESQHQNQRASIVLLPYWPEVRQISTLLLRIFYGHSQSSLGHPDISDGIEYLFLEIAGCSTQVLSHRSQKILLRHPTVIKAYLVGVPGTCILQGLSLTDTLHPLVNDKTTDAGFLSAGC